MRRTEYSALSHMLQPARNHQHKVPLLGSIQSDKVALARQEYLSQWH